MAGIVRKVHEGFGALGLAVQAGEGGVAPLAPAVPHQRRGGVQFHHTARKEAQMVASLLAAFGLVEAAALADHQRVRPQHQRARMQRRHRLRFGDSQSLGHLIGRSARKTSLHSALVDIGG